MVEVVEVVGKEGTVAYDEGVAFAYDEGVAFVVVEGAIVPRGCE